MKMYLQFEDKIQLTNAVDGAIQKAFGDLSMTEPQLIANLVSELPYKINSIKTLSGSKSIKAGGIFVHSRPLVTCNSFPNTASKSVEIGDLLFIRSLVIEGAIKERRALLLQAKKIKHIPTKPDNKNQWHLYERWPQFTYSRRSGDLKGIKRHIKEPDMYDAAKYLLIQSNPKVHDKNFSDYSDCLIHHSHAPSVHCHHYTAQPTKLVISRYRCLTSEIVDFLTGNAGKTFSHPTSKNDCGWNRVIDDLINDTAKAKSSYMNSTAGKSQNSTRGHGILFMTLVNQSDFLITGGSWEQDYNGFQNMPKQWGTDRGGISIIEVVIEQRDSR